MLNPEPRTLNPVAAFLAAVLLTAAPAARAQFGETVVPQSHFELSETVQVDRAESTVLGQLERVKAQLAEKQEEQWDEAIETLRQIMESAGGKLMAVTPTRFVGLRDYCNLQLAALPPKALALYRGRVDPLAPLVRRRRGHAKRPPVAQRGRAGVCQQLVRTIWQRSAARRRHCSRPAGMERRA